MEAEAIEMAAAKAATAEAKRQARDDKKSQVETETEPYKQVVNAQKAEVVPVPVPEPKAQRNFTAPESRIMPDGANKGAFVQAYNAQIAVDVHAQIIVAASVTQAANDAKQLVPLAKAIQAKGARHPEVSLARLPGREPRVFIHCTYPHCAKAIS